MTFVDYAELVWNRLNAGQTQQAVADGIGWSRDLVARYAAISKIDSAAWTVVTESVTGVTLDVTGDIDGGASDVEKAVTSPFTEGLLRNILDLTADQQLSLCKKLAKGKDSKSHKYSKKEFKSDAEWFRSAKVAATRLYPFSVLSIRSRTTH